MIQNCPSCGMEPQTEHLPGCADNAALTSPERDLSRVPDNALWEMAEGGDGAAAHELNGRTRRSYERRKVEDDFNEAERARTACAECGGNAIDGHGARCGL